MNDPLSPIILQINDLGSHGEGVGRHQELAIFVEGALPGERVEVELSKRQARYGRGKLLRVLEPSEERRDPSCPLFGSCGGCQLMHLSYEAQLDIKRKRVITALERIARLKEVSVSPCHPSPLKLGYRNKIQLPIKNSSEGLSLGLYAVGSHDLIPIERCQIHCQQGEEVFTKIQTLVKASGIQAYSPPHQGELRHLLIRTAMNREEVLVIIVTATPPSENLRRLAKQILESHPLVKGVVANINADPTNVILGQHYVCLEGADHIHEWLGALKFKISPASFFQVNPAQAVKLYERALALSEVSAQEVVIDAFCGVGTLALYFARHAKAVVGIESVAAAIADAKVNAQLNGITNARFHCARAENFIRQVKDASLLLLNPPRKGCDPALLEQVGRLAPSRIIYISCDPATLARDLAILLPFGYIIQTIEPFDMFPQTAHVETLAMLRRKLPDSNADNN